MARLTTRGDGDIAALTCMLVEISMGFGYKDTCSMAVAFGKPLLEACSSDLYWEQKSLLLLGFDMKDVPQGLLDIEPPRDQRALSRAHQKARLAPRRKRMSIQEHAAAKFGALASGGSSKNKYRFLERVPSMTFKDIRLLTVLNPALGGWLATRGAKRALHAPGPLTNPPGAAAACFWYPLPKYHTVFLTLRGGDGVTAERLLDDHNWDRETLVQLLVTAFKHGDYGCVLVAKRCLALLRLKENEARRVLRRATISCVRAGPRCMMEFDAFSFYGIMLRAFLDSAPMSPECLEMLVNDLCSFRIKNNGHECRVAIRNGFIRIIVHELTGMW